MPIAPSLSGLWPYILPVLLLSCSNIFMTLAWYGNLKFKTWTMVFGILVSWSIAFVEYCFAVPANRIGNAIYSPAELKSIQEVPLRFSFLRGLPRFISASLLRSFKERVSL